MWSQSSLIPWYRHLETCRAESSSLRIISFIANLICLLWQRPKKDILACSFLINSGWFFCGQEELPNGHFYLIIGYLDISNRLHNLFVSIASGSLIRWCLCLAHRFRGGFEVTVELLGPLETFVKKWQHQVVPQNFWSDHCKEALRRGY